MKRVYLKRFNSSIVILFVVLSLNFYVLSQSPLDSFNYSNAEESMARLDNFLAAIHKEPKNIGYIIVYGGKTNKYGEVKAHLEQIPHYVTNFRGFSGGKLIYIHGGFREKLTIELWVVSNGKCPPQPAPTVDAEKVIFKGKFNRKSMYLCCE